MPNEQGAAGAMLKVLLILIYLICDYQSIIGRFNTLDGILPFGLFIGLYVLLAAGLMAAASIRQHFVRIFLSTLLSVASVFKFSFERITSGTLTYQSFSNLYYASSEIDKAYSQYSNTIFLSFIISIILFIGISLPPRRFKIHPSVAIFAPALAISVLSIMLYFRGGEGSRGLPPAYAPISFATLMIGEAMAADHSPRQKSTLRQTSTPVSEDIVLIVDESVSANYLDINHINGVHSGLVQPHAGLRITNFGYASAIYKCSAESNVVLRFGGTPETYRTALGNWPSIWTYAKNAGLRTVYIDGQSEGGRLQDMMTNEERFTIDEFVQLDGVPVEDRDMRIASLIANRINNDQPEFIYVNKVGAHFPVAAKFPEARTRFRPVLPRETTSLSIWSSDLRGFNGTPEEWIRYRNSYRNTIEWNVGEFFDRLLSAPGIGKATVIYTSDHGQDLHERRNPGRNTHCGAEATAQEEGLVPLVIIDQPGANAPDWERHLTDNRNKASAFRVFPTLLALMGYDRNSMRKAYGTPLDERGEGQFAYLTDFSPLRGKKPSFRSINVNEIAAPPTEDFIRH